MSIVTDLEEVLNLEPCRMGGVSAGILRMAIESARSLEMVSDCRTCSLFDDSTINGCNSEIACQNADQYQPSPTVQLWIEHHG